MRKLYTIAAIAATFFAVTTAAGQSKSFKLGKWTEIHNGIVKELNRSYVDSLPVDRIMRAGVDAMLEELDPYTVYIPEEENDDLQMMLSNTYGGIGAIIHKPKGSNVIINEPYAGSPAVKSGLVCGDEIIAIDGVLTKGLEIKESTDRMKGKPGTTVMFKVKKARTGDTLDVPVVRERIHLPDVEYAAMINDTTGYLLLSGFTENVGADVRSKFIDLKKAGMKRFVLDLRGNGGGLLTAAETLASHFTNKKIKIGSIMHKTGAGHDAFSSPEPMHLSPAAGVIWLRPVIVLTNRGVFSSANHFVMMMRELPHVTIMGDKTGGGSGLPLSNTLPNGWSLRYSASPILDAQGNHTEFGIEPDVKVEITSEDWDKGIDTIIEEAIKLAKELTKAKEE
jgi:carboxyl-terminal processing protease